MSFNISRKYRLDEIGKITTGKTPSTKDKSNFGGNICFITPGDLQSGKHINITERYLTEKGTKEVKNCILPRNSICVSCIGTIGYVGLTSSISITNQQINSITPFKYFDEDFVYYLMKNNWKHFKLLENQSTTLSILNKSQFSKLEFTVPPKENQTKIAKLLSVLDDKIELNKKINKTLEEMAQVIFKSWFVDFEPFKDNDFIESELGYIPQGWSCIELEKFIEYQEGPGIRNWQYVEDGTRFINIRCLLNGDLDLSTANMISNIEANGKYSHFLVKEWDILVSSSGTLGRYGIIRNEHLPLCMNTSVIRFFPRIHFNHYAYIFSYLTSNIFYNHLLTKSSGSVQANFGPMHLRQIKVLLPDNKTLNDYNKLVFPKIKKIVKNYSENEKLIEIRDSLLPKLMSGEIRVPLEEVPNAEVR